MKILWLSDAGCHTGFGKVTHSIGERLVRDYGHEVHVLAINYRGDPFPSTITPGAQTELRLWVPNIRLQTDVYGNTRVVELLLEIEPDMVVTLNDAHITISQLLENKVDPQKILLRMRPIISYIPVDGINLPPQWPQVMTAYTKVVTMSRFGQAAYPGSELVYHGVDTDKFWPVSNERPIEWQGEKLRTKRQCRKALGMNEDAVWVLRVDSNSGRKDYASTWRALAPVMRRHPNVMAFFHCDPTKLTAAGTDLHAVMSRDPDIDTKTRVTTPGDRESNFKGWPEEAMNILYNAADIFVSTSRGEGFGLTLAEAAACGLPIVAQNVSAIPEVVGPGGILLEPLTTLTVPSGEDVWLADIPAFEAAIEKLVMSKGARRDLGRKGHEHVTSSFSWDFAAKRFHELLLADKEQYDRAYAERKAAANLEAKEA